MTVNFLIIQNTFNLILVCRAFIQNRIGMDVRLTLQLCIYTIGPEKNANLNCMNIDDELEGVNNSKASQ